MAFKVNIFPLVSVNKIPHILKNSDMVIIIVWITILLDCEFESLKYRVYFNNNLISVCSTKEEAIEYINKVKKNYKGMKFNGTIYEEYIN
jgi:hypothetical protein